MGPPLRQVAGWSEKDRRILSFKFPISGEDCADSTSTPAESVSAQCCDMPVGADLCVRPW